MKIKLVNYSRYKMTKMPFRFYLPRLRKYFNGKLWILTILRDYGIEVDLRNGNILNQLVKMKYVHLFDKIIFRNRWAKRRYSRSCNWTIIGISKEWFSPGEYEYRISLFGFDLSIWMKRRLVNDNSFND